MTGSLARLASVTHRPSGFAGRRRYACRESARASYADAVAASMDACGRHMSGAPMRRTYRSMTRITQTELAARNRRARFPATQRVGTLRNAPAGDPTRPAIVEAAAPAGLRRRDL